jgi:hypothetical protein
VVRQAPSLGEGMLPCWKQVRLQYKTQITILRLVMALGARLRSFSKPILVNAQDG